MKNKFRKKFSILSAFLLFRYNAFEDSLNDFGIELMKSFNILYGLTLELQKGQANVNAVENNCICFKVDKKMGDYSN